MNNQTLATHAAAIERELSWLQAVIEARFTARHSQERPSRDELIAPPDIADMAGPFARVLRDMALNAHERLVLILTMAPHLMPEVLDPFLLQNQATGRRFSEFGGVVGQSHTGFLPTVETAMALLAGTDLQERLKARQIFSPHHKLISARVLEIDQQYPDEPPTSSRLRLSKKYLEILLTGEGDAFPSIGEFPAVRITTPLEWDDLVLDTVTRDQIELIRAWIKHSHTLMHDWHLAKRLKPGYRCLFHGTPGTGKTMTACLLGKQHDIPVYRVDLSQVVSKWVGETEKNLASLFDVAQDQNWILFFDEADALFGRRTEASTANDRSANQQIAYLLQRMEDFPGLMILSTNQRGHMDDAFARRFQSTILFPMPDASSRLTLWEKMFRTGHIALAPDINFEILAEKYALAGGAIINVLRYACLRAVVRSPAKVEIADIMGGIKLELQKEGHYLGS